MKRYVIIVAGGFGKRFGSHIPKQFMNVAGKPVLMHAIERFSDLPQLEKIIIALPGTFFDYWKSLAKKHDFNIPHILSEGGETRFHSVKNALTEVDENGFVAIHDGVRPLLEKTLVQKLFEEAGNWGNAIPAITPVNSMRSVNERGSAPVDRDKLRIIQTPQVFRSDLLMEAYNQDYEEQFTDDSIVIEKAGHKIHLVKGQDSNIKITRPFDLKIAELFLTGHFD